MTRIRIKDDARLRIIGVPEELVGTEHNAEFRWIILKTLRRSIAIYVFEYKGETYNVNIKDVEVLDDVDI